MCWDQLCDPVLCGALALPGLSCRSSIFTPCFYKTGRLKEKHCLPLENGVGLFFSPYNKDDPHPVKTRQVHLYSWKKDKDFLAGTPIYSLSGPGISLYEGVLTTRVIPSGPECSGGASTEHEIHAAS